MVIYLIQKTKVCILRVCVIPETKKRAATESWAAEEGSSMATAARGTVHRKKKKTHSSAAAIDEIDWRWLTGSVY